MLSVRRLAPVTAVVALAVVVSAAFSQGELLPAGSVAPDFEAVAPDGSRVTMSSLRGRVAVVAFWSTSSQACRRALPRWDKVHAASRAASVATIALCVADDRANYDKWVAENRTNISLPTAFDPAGKSRPGIAAKYGIGAIPAVFVLDKNGRVVESFSGYGPGDTRLEQALAKAGVRVSVPVD